MLPQSVRLNFLAGFQIQNKINCSPCGDGRLLSFSEFNFRKASTRKYKFSRDAARTSFKECDMHKKTVTNYPLHKNLANNQLLSLIQNGFLLTPVEAGAVCGWAKQTVYNKLYEKNFPIPLVNFNGRRMVKASDLLEYQNNLPYEKLVSKKSGRPTKSESIHRRLENKARAI